EVLTGFRNLGELGLHRRHYVIGLRAAACRMWGRARRAADAAGGSHLPVYRPRTARPGGHEGRPCGTRRRQAALVRLVDEVGLEPTRDFSHGLLRPARLPVTPLVPAFDYLR